MAVESLTHKYIPRIEQTEKNIFMEEYYSSTDVKIYIDGEEITEVSYINYSLQEQLKPIYGYASRTFDDVAIGNRIVTGIIKIPIKNAEAQSTVKEIESQIISTNNDYNDKEDDVTDNVDWITPDIPSVPSDVTPENNIVNVENNKAFEYQTKLINLGYDLDYNSSLEVYKGEIKKFQASHNIDTTGELTTQTMDEIDKALTNNLSSKMIIPAGTKIYLGPETFFDYFTTTEDQEVFILDDGYDNGWVYIMTKDGTEGYINKNSI